VQEAVNDYRYLLDHESDPAEVMRVLTFLATHTDGEEKIKLLSRSWEMLLSNPNLVKKDDDYRSRIAHELADYYTSKQDYENALKWVQECTRMVEEVNPDLTTGKTLRARYNLAMAQRKANQDLVSFRTLRAIQNSIDQMSDEDKSRLEQAEKGLYRSTIRELSRACLLLGDKTTAKTFARKIGENLPEKVR
jgi:lipopolysaccharide biosynthesis regulator YciM